MIRSAFILTLVFVCQTVLAQTFSLKNFRVEDGLPSSQVYDVNQDQKGNLWIATDLGLTSYDGYTFRTYSEKDGLADNTINKIHISSDGSIWALGFNQKLSVFKDGENTRFSLNNELKSALSGDFIRSMWTSNNELFIGVSQACSEPSYLLKATNGKILKESLESGYTIFNQNGQSVSGNSCPIVPSQINFTGFENKIKLTLEPGDGSILSICHNGRDGYLITDRFVIDFENTNRYNMTSTSTGSSLIDTEGNLWVSTYSGVLFFARGDLSKEPKKLLNNISISTVFQDVDGAIWIGSYSKGLYWINNLQLLTINELDGYTEPDVLKVFGNGPNVFFADSRNNLYRSNLSGETNLFGKLSSKVEDIQMINNTPVFLENQLRRQGQFSYPVNGLSFSTGPKSGITWVGKIFGFAGYKDGLEVFNSNQLQFNNRVNSIIEDSTGTLWLGTLNGIYKGDTKSVSQVESTKGLRIDKLGSQNQQIIFISRGNGLGFLNQNEEVEIKNEENGLISNFTNDLYLQGSRIWCATNSGVSVYEDGTFRSLGRKDGLPSAEVNSVWANDDQIYLGTRKGLAIVQMDYLNRDSRKISVDITGLSLENEPIKMSDLVLPYEQNSLTIKLIARDFRIDNPINYRYRLSNEVNWSYTKTPQVTYASLPPGKWKFICSAQNQQGEWGPENETLVFKVSKPYYLQWWFIVSVLVVVSLCIWMYTQWKFKQSQKAELTKNELNVLKIKALSSQMNPHFIFNSLNSIQNFLVDNDIRMSNKYLTKFARLMRLILNNSNETFVPLKDVLSTLELYMELEQLRFNNKFEYKISLGPDLEIESTKVPSMLLQPFIENAILHGILPKQSNGIITLDMKRVNDNSLQVKIIDDGVGRAFHKNKVGKKHKSHGLRITQERLKVFESLLGNKFNLTIHDLKDEEGKPKGTEIELFLPTR